MAKKALNPKSPVFVAQTSSMVSELSFVSKLTPPFSSVSLFFQNTNWKVKRHVSTSTIDSYTPNYSRWLILTEGQLFSGDSKNGPPTWPLRPLDHSLQRRTRREAGEAPCHIALSVLDASFFFSFSSHKKVWRRRQFFCARKGPRSGWRDMWTPMGRSGTRKRPKLSVPVVTAREKQRQDEGVADPAAERFAEMLFGVARADHSIVHTRNVAIDFSADIPTVSFMDESARAPGLERIMQKLCKMSSSRLELVQWIQDLLDAFQSRMQQVSEQRIDLVRQTCSSDGLTCLKSSRWQSAARPAT